MAPSYLLGTLLLLGDAFAFQQLPLFDPASVAAKELVSSASLQERIHSDNLFDRAKTLYSIAQLGEDEYNHPTRVIGSKGTCFIPAFHLE